jgi:hypothetical protein
MASLNANNKIAMVDLYSSDTTQVGPGAVGAIQWGSNGKGFKYALNGGAALVKGNLLQSAAQASTYINMVVGTAGSVGDAFIQVTNGTSTITSQAFEGGSISVYTAGTVAIADEYTILAVTGTLTTGGALKVWLDRPLRYAYTTSATVNMQRNPCSGLIQYPATTQTGVPAGVAIYELPLATYGWVQFYGICGVLSDASTFAVGSALSPSLTTAGAVGVNVAGTTHCNVGVSYMAAASAKGIVAHINI